MKECYIKAAPDFVNLDTDQDGSAFGEKVISEVQKNQPDTLIVDISESFVDYYGCGPVIVSAIEAIRDPAAKIVRTIAVLTSMNYGAKARYADLFFKGTKYEKPNLGFLEIAYTACQDMCIELKIWVVPRYDFTYSDLASLKNPTVILSSK